MESEREKLRQMIAEWNKERWDMFALSEPNEVRPTFWPRSKWHDS